MIFIYCGCKIIIYSVLYGDELFLAKGLLIVNSFVQSEKFDGIYSLLEAAASEYGVELERVCGAQLLAKLCADESFELPDFVIFWDKDIRLASLLEMRGVRLFNSAKAVETCDDKSLTFLALKEKGIPQPDTVIAPKTYPMCGYWKLDFLDEAEKRLGYPMVIKECFGSFGKQVHLANSRKEAEEIIASLGASPFIMQRLVATSFGRDVRISVVGKKAVASMLRCGSDGDFRSNLTIGGHSEKFDATEAQKAAAVAACEAVGLDFGGVDVLFGENGEPIICEINSNAHFKTTLDCTGVNMAEHIIKHILREIGEVR